MFLFKAHEVINIYQQKKCVTCILMYKHNRGMLPNILNDMFMKHTPSHNYNMRQNIAYKNTTLQNQYQTKHTHYVGPKLWNTVIMKIILMIVRLRIYLKR